MKSKLVILYSWGDFFESIDSSLGDASNAEVRWARGYLAEFGAPLRRVFPFASHRQLEGERNRRRFLAAFYSDSNHCLNVKRAGYSARSLAMSTLNTSSPWNHSRPSRISSGKTLVTLDGKGILQGRKPCRLA